MELSQSRQSDNPNNPGLTEDQLAQMRQVKSLAPYRLVWAMVDKDTGEFAVYAAFDRRQANRAAREGHRVYILA